MVKMASLLQGLTVRLKLYIMLLVLLLVVFPIITGEVYTVNSVMDNQIIKKRMNCEEIYDQLTSVDERTVKIELSSPPGDFAFKPPNCLIMPYEQYIQCINSGKLDSEKLGKVKGIYTIRIVNSLPDNWRYGDTVVLIEPRLNYATFKIEGTLSPSEGHLYNHLRSCACIEVSLSWTPDDQVIGIMVFNTETGEGQLAWCIGGSVDIPFEISWEGCYAILILSHPSNTQAINYSGKVILWIW